MSQQMTEEEFKKCCLEILQGKINFSIHIGHYVTQQLWELHIEQVRINTLVTESLSPPQPIFWPCPNCNQDTSESKWLCYCSQECFKEHMDKHKQLLNGIKTQNP